jgi:hypothetical protein
MYDEFLQLIWETGYVDMHERYSVQCNISFVAE